MPKRKGIPAPSLPKSHLAALAAAGFTVMVYLNQSIEVEGGSREWLPRIAVGTNPNGGFRLVEWLPASHPSNIYDFDGWQTYSGHSCGGMCKEIGQALSWFNWLEEQKAGKK